MTSSNQSEDELLVFARRVLVATLVVVSVLLLLLLIWYAADLLMLVFAAVLISILLRSVSEFLVQKTRLSHGLALAIVEIGLIALIMGASWLVTGRIAAQMRQLQLLLPEAVQNVKNYIGQYEWGRNAIDSLPSLNEWIARRGGTVISQLTGLASTTVGVVINILIVFISGLYLASQPDVIAQIREGEPISFPVGPSIKGPSPCIESNRLKNIYTNARQRENRSFTQGELA